jgi:hypothetical protein
MPGYIPPYNPYYPGYMTDPNTGVANIISAQWNSLSMKDNVTLIVKTLQICCYIRYADFAGDFFRSCDGD